MSVKRDRRSLVVSTVAILFLGLTGSAWGHGFSRGAFGRTGVAGLRGPHSGGLLLRLIFPCRGDCFDAARTCDEMAESAAVTCAEQTCDAEIQTARTACAADVTTPDCQTARTALLQCIQPCLAAEQSAVTSCRLEQRVKKVNFTLLVRIKNQLDPQQQEKLRALRRAHPFGPPGGPPP